MKSLYAASLFGDQIISRIDQGISISSSEIASQGENPGVKKLFTNDISFDVIKSYHKRDKEEDRCIDLKHI